MNKLRIFNVLKWGNAFKNRLVTRWIEDKMSKSFRLWLKIGMKKSSENPTFRLRL